MKKRMAIIAGALAMVLLVAACSSDEEPAAEPATATSESMPSEAAEADTSMMTITEIAAGNEDFSTLVTAVGAADLAETLSSDGPFTVFAPTNEAFEALPPGTVENLLKPKNKDALAGVLTYHVVPGAIMAADVAPGEVETVNGATFEIGMGENAPTITDGMGGTANIVATDIVASNGVIHVIDAVLLPPDGE